MAPSEGKRLLPPSEGVTRGLKEVLDIMRGDEVGSVVRKDRLIVDFSSLLYFQLGQHVHLHPNIRKK